MHEALGKIEVERSVMRRVLCCSWKISMLCALCDRHALLLDHLLLHIHHAFGETPRIRHARSYAARMQEFCESDDAILSRPFGRFFLWSLGEIERFEAHERDVRRPPFI